MDKKCNLTGFGSSVNMSYPMANFDDALRQNCSFDYNFEYSQRPSGPDKNTEIAFKLIFYFVAAIENVLLLYVMKRDPLKRFRNSTSYLIGNFAIADLVSIISGICDSIFQLNPKKVQHNYEIAGCFQGIGVQCSFLIITIFAMDRYMAIVHPYKYKNIMNRKFVLIILILVPWCFAIIALPVIYFAPAYGDGRTLTNMFAGDIIALTIITLIVHPLTHWTFKRKIKELSKSSYMNKLILAESLKAAKVLATTVLMVSLCLIIFMSPYLVAFGFNLAGCDKCLLNHAFQSFWKYYPLLVAVRLMANSFVYTWRLPLYRESLKTLTLHIRFRPTTSIDNSRLTRNSRNTSDQTAPSHLSQSSEFLEENNNKSVPGKTLSNRHGPLKEIGIENNADTSKDTSFHEKF